MKKIPSFLIAILFFLVTACGKSTAPSEEKLEPTQAGKQFDLDISSVWSRSTPELINGSGIIYMTINNTGDSIETLLAGKTPIAKSIELHMHTIDSNGVFRMRMVDGGRIEIPAGESVELKPGGLHIMMIELTDSLKAGDSFPITLKFEQAGEVTFFVPITDMPPTEVTSVELKKGGYESLK